MSASKSRAKRARGILAGHQRIGKKLKSPISALPQMQATSYVEEILPEIVHIAMAYETFGYHDGIRLLETYFGIMAEFCEHSHLPIVSNLGDIDIAALTDITTRFAAAGISNQLATVNTPLMLIDGWPLAYLGKIEIDASEALQRLEKCVGNILDKRTTAACASLATLLYWQGVCGKLHYVNGVAPPDLDAIVSQPGSAEAEMASAQVRASTMAFWSLGVSEGGVSRDWAEAFWQKCFKLSPCVDGGDDVDQS